MKIVLSPSDVLDALNVYVRDQLKISPDSAVGLDFTVEVGPDETVGIPDIIQEVRVTLI